MYALLTFHINFSALVVAGAMSEGFHRHGRRGRVGRVGGRVGRRGRGRGGFRRGRQEGDPALQNYGAPAETTAAPPPPGDYDYDYNGGGGAVAPLGSYGAGSAQNGVAADDAGGFGGDAAGGFAGDAGGFGGDAGGFGGDAGGAGGSGDPNLAMLEKAVPGVPGEDYPIFAEVPDTAFTCDGQVDGGKSEQL